jgi:hypothetical protein
MVVLDTPVQPEETSSAVLSNYYQGQDGWLYSEDRDSENMLGRPWLRRLSHRWYVCHRCQRLVLGAGKILVRVHPLP